MCIYTNLSPVLLFKLAEVSPGVSQIRIDFYGSLEPLSSLTDLPLGPKQPVAERGREGERERGREGGGGGMMMDRGGSEERCSDAKETRSATC